MHCASAVCEGPRCGECLLVLGEHACSMPSSWHARARSACEPAPRAARRWRCALRSRTGCSAMASWRRWRRPTSWVRTVSPHQRLWWRQRDLRSPAQSVQCWLAAPPMLFSRASSGLTSCLAFFSCPDTHADYAQTACGSLLPQPYYVSVGLHIRDLPRGSRRGICRAARAADPGRTLRHARDVGGPRRKAWGARSAVRAVLCPAV